MIVPARPMSLDEVQTAIPTVRQSTLSGFDDCALSAYFSIRYLNGWSTTAQARGTLLHRTYAECLETMRRQGHTTIPISEALEILLEVCRQRGVPAEDIVRVPLRQMPELRMAVAKFARDNQFSTSKIVDVERRLEAPISYTTAEGEVITRRFTGQLDVLLFDPPDGAVIVDFKTGYGLPPEPRDAEPQGYDDEELKGLSYLGYFQQRAYGLLVLANYTNVNRVTLREFYPYKSVVRKATLHRHQLPQVVEELSIMIEAFDAAVASGPPNLRANEDGLVDIYALGWWKPSPGKHCSYCAKPTACPIEDDVRIASGGAATAESASRWAARMQIAERIRKMAIEGLKGYVEEGGAPVPVKWSKGRQVIGWYQTKRGRRFGAYVPDESDRGGHADMDAQLVEAMRDSTARARSERGVKPRRRRTPA